MFPHAAVANRMSVVVIKRFPLWLGMLICLLHLPIASAMLDIRSSPDSGLDVSLLYHQNEFSLTGAGYELNTDVLGLGFEFIDIPPNLPIQIGMGGGYAFVDQQTVSGLDNSNMGGYYFSLLARTPLFSRGSWEAMALLKYNYLRVQHSSETQSARLRWNHFNAQALLDYSPVGYFSLSFGIILALLDANLSGSGDTNLSIDMDSEEHTAALVGLNYHLDDTQKMAVILQQGYNNRLVIQFQRTFY